MAAPRPELVWALFVYAWIAHYMIRLALSSLLPSIMAELSLSYTEAGLLATAFFYAYLVMQIPAGLLGDRWGRKRVLLGGILVGVIGSLLTGLSTGFAMLFLARLLTGVGQGSLFSNDRVLIITYTPKEKIALGQGASFSGLGLGTTLGLLLAGVLGELIPWRGVFVVFAGLPLLAALFIWRLIPEPPLAAMGSGLASLRRVARQPDVWIVSAAHLTVVYLQFVLAIWAPLFFAEIGVTELGRSAFYASLQGLPAPFGLLLMGWVADRVHRRGFDRKVVSALSFLGAAVSFAGVGLVVHAKGSPALLAALIVITSFFFWGGDGPLLAILGQLVPPSLLATAFGFLNTVGFVAALVGPALTGWMKDVTGSFALACYAAALVGGIGATLAFAIRPSFRARRAGPIAP